MPKFQVSVTVTYLNRSVTTSGTIADDAFNDVGDALAAFLTTHDIKSDNDDPERGGVITVYHAFRIDGGA